jgi:ABC-2 type transport system permease protein
MSTYRAALSAEILKARRSKVPALTLLVVTAAGGITALFMIVTLDPGRAERLGLLRQKAQLSGITGDWAGMLSFLAQIVAVGDLLLFAFITTWVFGREAADGTLRYLLALPVPRSSVVLAKFTVVAGWATLADLWLAGVTLLLGRLLPLPDDGSHVVLTGLAHAGVAAALMLAATTPVALIASAGRGYLAPLACAVMVLVVAQVAAALGWAALVPWSIPAVAAGLVPGVTLSPSALMIAVLTGAGGVLGTLAWWRSGHAER